MRRFLLAVMAAIGFALPAHAQDHFFPTPGNARVDGAVVMCLNAQGQAVPATSTGNCLGGGSGGGGLAPGAATTTVTNGTIAVTNTFQSALASNAARKGCTMQNQGTHVMYVFFGATGSATTASSLQLQSGQTISCASGVIVATDNIAITGTSGDAFVMNAQ